MGSLVAKRTSQFLVFAIMLAALCSATFMANLAPANAQSTQDYYVYVEPLPYWAASYASNAIYTATKAWEDANPHINFYQASSPESADLIVQWIRDYGSEYMGETIGGSVIQVGLGDSGCMGEWHPFSSETVVLIAEHELGHFLGLGHSSDENSIMYPTLKVRYGIVELEESLAPGYVLFVPICTSEEVTSYWYQVEIDDSTYGFDVYFVASKDEYDNYLAGETFYYYSDDECYGENYRRYGGTCEGVSDSSGLLVILDKQLSSPLQRVKVQLLEQPPYMASNNMPAIGQEETKGFFTESDLDSILMFPVTKYTHVDGTDYSILTTTSGGSVTSISVNPYDASLIISLDPSNDGTITIRQPRALIDSKEDDGNDSEFIVFANGYLATSEEIEKDSDYRTIKVYFDRNTETIEIIGTQVVPEFGQLTFLVFSLVLTCIILSTVVSKRRLGSIFEF